MRIAILGNGPLSWEMAGKIKEIGGDPVLFLEKDVSLPSCVSEVIVEDGKKSLESFIKDDLAILKSTMSEAINIKRNVQIDRIHKKFLNHGEVIDGRSRVMDFFTVIYSVDPNESVLDQIETNKQIFNSLDEEVIDSLKNRIEVSEDFDIVVDAREVDFLPSFSGVDGQLALNEVKVNSEIFYGISALEKHDIKNKNVLVVLNDLEKSLFVESYFGNQLSNCSSLRVVSSSHIGDKLSGLSDCGSEMFEKDVVEFETSILKWKALEDYEKVKVSKPLEPARKVIFFDQYTVTSIDSLVDREGFFVTVEKPSFYGVEDLKTIHCEMLFVLSKREQRSDNFCFEEEGFYCLNKSFLSGKSYDFKSAKFNTSEIMKSIMSFFSKGDNV